MTSAQPDARVSRWIRRQPFRRWTIRTARLERAPRCSARFTGVTVHAAAGTSNPARCAGEFGVCDAGVRRGISGAR